MRDWLLQWIPWLAASAVLVAGVGGLLFLAGFRPARRGASKRAPRQPSPVAGRVAAPLEVLAAHGQARPAPGYPKPPPIDFTAPGAGMWPVNPPHEPGKARQGGQDGYDGRHRSDALHGPTVRLDALTPTALLNDTKLPELARLVVEAQAGMRDTDDTGELPQAAQ